jgi:hypothetical protein
MAINNPNDIAPPNDELKPLKEKANGILNSIDSMLSSLGIIPEDNGILPEDAWMYPTMPPTQEGDDPLTDSVTGLSLENQEEVPTDESALGGQVTALDSLKSDIKKELSGEINKAMSGLRSELKGLIGEAVSKAVSQIKIPECNCSDDEDNTVKPPKTPCEMRGDC